MSAGECRRRVVVTRWRMTRFNEAPACLPGNGAREPNGPHVVPALQ